MYATGEHEVGPDGTGFKLAQSSGEMHLIPPNATNRRGREGPTHNHGSDKGDHRIDQIRVEERPQHRRPTLDQHAIHPPLRQKTQQRRRFDTPVTRWKQCHLGPRAA